MQIIGKSKQERLDFFECLYHEAEQESCELIEKQRMYYEQYKGSRAIDGSDVEAKQVRNITYELIESQVSSYIPCPSVTPKVYSSKNEMCAKSVETLLRNKRDELPFERMNDIDERFSPIYGGSVWLIEWDESIVTHTTVGDVKVSCLSPRKFLGQPGIYEVQDMEYCFITFESTKEDIVRKYGVDMEVAERAESDENRGVSDDTATLYVCYYKNDDDNVCQFVWSGDEVLLDIEDYYSRKRRVCRACGMREEACGCEKPKLELLNDEFEELERNIPLSDGTAIPAQSVIFEHGQPVMERVSVQMKEDNGEPAFERYPDGTVMPIMTETLVPKTEKTRLPYYRMNMIPVVIRKNTSEEENLFGQSDCEVIRPQQQGINKLESRIVEKLLRAGIYAVVPEDYNGDLDNGVFDIVLRAKPENYNMFGRVDLQVSISSDIAQAERLYDQAKRLLGISDTFQGQHDASAQSGKAKQLQIQQAAGRLESKKRMKNAAYADIDKIIFQYYLAYADEPREASYKNTQGQWQNVTFNRYDFIRRDSAGEYYYDDSFMFSADASADMDRAREIVWAENRQNFSAGAYGDPASIEARLILWQVQERYHYPFARDIVEILKEQINKQMQMLQTAQMSQRGGLPDGVGAGVSGKELPSAQGVSPIGGAPRQAQDESGVHASGSHVPSAGGRMTAMPSAVRGERNTGSPIQAALSKGE